MNNWKTTKVPCHQVYGIPPEHAWRLHQTGQTDPSGREPFDHLIHHLVLLFSSSILMENMNDHRLVVVINICLLNINSSDRSRVSILWNLANSNHQGGLKSVCVIAILSWRGRIPYQSSPKPDIIITIIIIIIMLCSLMEYYFVFCCNLPQWLNLVCIEANPNIREREIWRERDLWN